jgi:hypothetical protein
VWADTDKWLLLLAGLGIPEPSKYKRQNKKNPINPVYNDQPIYPKFVIFVQIALCSEN